MPRYVYSQEDGNLFKVVSPNKCDAQEDTNEIRQVVNDLGDLLHHSKFDDAYPKDLTTGGYLGKLNSGADASKPASPAVSDMYLATDTVKIYRCFTATAWTQVYPVANLLSTTTIAFNADADTTLYTVPTGKRCVLSHAIVVAAGDAGGTTTVSIGQNTAETDFIPANTLSNLDAEYDSVILQPIPNATPLKIKSYEAATVIEARVASQSGVAGNTIYLFGILY